MGASPLKAVSTDLGRRVAAHALNRLGYGPRPGDVDAVLAQGVEQWVEEQLAPAGDPDLDARLAGFRTLGYSVSQVLALYNADQRTLTTILDEFNSAKMIRAVHARNQLQEVLVDFWFNHFNVDISGSFERYSVPAYERDAIRPHVLGRFRDLLGATAAHPAMLYYLDNYLSRGPRVVGGRVVNGLNENYGRELLELHTVGVSAGYAQSDVVDAARCFTGWTIDNLRTGGNFVYVQANHDPGTKSVFGLNLPAGGGKDDGDKLLDHLAAHPASAEFVSRRLAQRFVSDDPPAGLVAAMAEAFLASGGDIALVLKRMVSSAAFWAAAFDGSSKPKTPIEFTASALRALDVQVSSAQGLTTPLAGMGMPLYRCNPPTGYSNRGADWLNPSAHLSRENFGLDLASGAVRGVSIRPGSIVSGADLANPRAIATAFGHEILPGRLSAQTVDAVARLDTRSTVSVAARSLGLLLASPDFQVR
jgi:uncharacterized protein (DUF1800 family)